MKTIEKSIETLRADLKAAGVKYKGNPGLAKLQQLATENGVEITQNSLTRSIVPTSYKTTYAKHGGTCGDELAVALSEAAMDDAGKVSLEQLEKVAKQNGIDFGRWSHLNVGQQRMNLANVLRAKLKKGEAIKVGKVNFEALAA